MKRSIILAALVMSMAVTVFAEEEAVWEDQTVVDDPAFVFEEEAISVEEQTASEEPEYVFEEPAATIEEESTDEDTVFEEIAFDEGTDLIQEDSVFEERVTEDLVSKETASEQTSAVDIPHAVTGLVYTGEPQALITAQDGDWSYSLDGEEYSTELPIGVNAGEYTVYIREGDTDPVSITVTIAKADVTFTPPVANTTSQSATDEPDGGNEVGEEPAYADEVVFEDLFE